MCTMTGVSDHLSPEQDPYLLTSRHEILHLFRRMLDKGLLIQMKGRRYAVSAVTTLLDVDVKAGRLVLDSASQAAINQALLGEGRAGFEVLVEQVKVQFTGEPLQAVIFEGRPALSMPIPASVRRIQRRGNFRVQVPVANPATCTLPQRPRPLTLALYDISSSGLAMVLPQPEVKLPVGAMLRDATLLLPGVGRMQADLQVVREEEHELANGKRVRHVGAAFVELKGGGQNLLQSYILGLERQMIARKRGLG